MSNSRPRAIDTASSLQRDSTRLFALCDLRSSTQSLRVVLCDSRLSRCASSWLLSCASRLLCAWDSRSRESNSYTDRACGGPMYERPLVASLAICALWAPQDASSSTCAVWSLGIPRQACASVSYRVAGMLRAQPPTCFFDVLIAGSNYLGLTVPAASARAARSCVLHLTSLQLCFVRVAAQRPSTVDRALVSDGVSSVGAPAASP